MKVSVDKIRRLCKEKGTNIHRLEKECGFSKGYIYKLHNHDATGTNLFKISKVLGVSMEELFEEST